MLWPRHGAFASGIVQCLICDESVVLRGSRPRSSLVPLQLLMRPKSRRPDRMPKSLVGRKS